MVSLCLEAGDWPGADVGRDDHCLAMRKADWWWAQGHNEDGNNNTYKSLKEAVPLEMGRERSVRW